VLSLFSILRVTAGVRAAFLTAMVFSPTLGFGPQRWDYIDGPGVAYCLLALALLTRSARQPVRRGSLLWRAVRWRECCIRISPGLALRRCCLLLHRDGLAWHRTPMFRSLAAVCLWSARIRNRNSGFQRRQLPARCSFWYLRTTIETARSLAANWRYPTSIWENGRPGTVVVVRRGGGNRGLFFFFHRRLRKGRSGTTQPAYCSRHYSL